mmetsp:Transcript_31443/g.82144  ORF Transcript_31443/g.82144 Transcript_31443/m.82144 type:complete len:207 (+) Transcript_31443:304-924(+)
MLPRGLTTKQRVGAAQRLLNPRPFATRSHAATAAHSLAIRVICCARATPSSFDAEQVLAIGHKEESHRLRGTHVRRVAHVEAAPLDLDRLALADGAHRGLALGRVGEPRLLLRIEDVLELVFLLHLVLREQKVELDQLDLNRVLGRVREPRELLLGLLDIAGEVELTAQPGDGTVGGAFDRAHDRVAPRHERHLLVRHNHRDILLL